MILVRHFKSWKVPSILGALVLLSLIFLFVPPTQSMKNRALYQAVRENNITKAIISIQEGAQTQLLLPGGLPLISLAIEFENEKLVELLVNEDLNISYNYDGYHIMEHALEKKNKSIILLLMKYLK